MGAREVQAPDGRVWKVGRRWIGDRPRPRRERDPFDGGGGGEDDGSWWGELVGIDDITPAGILAGLAITIAMVVIFALAWPVVAIAVEIVFLLLAAAVGVVGRLLFRRPWTVRARTTSATPKSREWKVSGWRASGELIDRVSEQLAEGADPREIEAR